MPPTDYRRLYRLAVFLTYWSADELDQLARDLEARVGEAKTALGAQEQRQAVPLLRTALAYARGRE